MKKYYNRPIVEQANVCLQTTILSGSGARSVVQFGTGGAGAGTNL